MLNILFKKQLQELKYSYFKDRKTGKIKSKKAIIGYAILYVFIYLLLGFSIFAITMGVKEFIPDPEDVWIIGSLMAFLTLFVGTFINMLITKGILYDAKDNELLLSLPIEDKYIILARMINVFANAIIYTSLLWIPMIVHTQIYLGFNVLNLIYGIITLILLTLTVTALSCLFGHLIARLTRKVKKKNLVTTILTFILLGLYYYIYFNANRYLTALLMYKEEFISFLNTKGILLSVLGKAVTGNSISLLIAIGIYLAITIIGFLLILPNYRKQLIATPAFAKKEFKGNYSKQSSVANTLISREVKLFFSNATYTLNCGLSVIILVGGAIALIIFKGKIDELLPLLDILPIVKTVLPILLLCAILLIVGMDALSVPAVSLEGKNYWIVRSLPISTYDILNSKRTLQFRMHVIPSVLLAFVCTFIFKIDDITQILFILSVATGVSCISYFDLFLGIKGANLKWTDPTSVVKQSGNVFIAIFGDMIFFAGLGALYVFVLSGFLPTEAYLGIVIAIFALVSVILDRWVKVKGTKLFEDLG